MKSSLKSILACTLIGVGLSTSAFAQDDPVVKIEPQPAASDGGVIYHGGGVAVDTAGRHADASRMQGARHMLNERNHPHPVYAHSRRGARATWTHNWNEQQAMMRPWHGNYYHYQYGTPVALVTPPTAAFQTNWSWGVGRTTSTPIYHQFARPYPGFPSGAPHGLQATPYWPSNTNQFGVYYVRGPW